MYRGADKIDSLNAALALSDRAKVELDRAKRSKTTTLAVWVPLEAVIVAAYLVPAAIPTMVLAVMALLFIAGAAMITHALTAGEASIQRAENELVMLHAKARELGAAPVQLALPETGGGK